MRLLRVVGAAIAAWPLAASVARPETIVVEHVTMAAAVSDAEQPP